MSPRERPLVRWGLALCALVAHLGASVHFTALDHVRCTEHGEWIELAPAPAAAAFSPVHRERVVGSERGAHHHDHCAVANASGARLVASDRASITLAASRDFQPSVVVVLQADHRRLLLLIAPKGSPPA